MSITAATPMYGGDLSIARDIVGNLVSNKMLWLGDSIIFWQGNGAGLYTEITRRWPKPKITDIWDSAFGGFNNSLGGSATVSLTQNYEGAWNDSVSNAIGLIGLSAPWGSTQALFAGGTSGTGVYTDVPGQRLASPTINQSNNIFTVWSGDFWARSLGGGTAGMFTAVMVNNTNGIASGMKFRVRGSDNAITLSSEFNTAGTGQYFQVITCAIPITIPTTDVFRVDWCFAPSAAATNGKNAILAGVHYSTNETPAFGMFFCGVPGSDTTYWVNTSHFSVDCWTNLVPAMGFDLLVIMLGINNQAAITAAQYKAHIQTLITRWRLGVPNGRVMLIAPFASASSATDSNAGGPLYEDYFCAPLYQISQETSRCFFANLNKYMGPQAILANAVSGDHNPDNVHLLQQGEVHYADALWAVCTAAAVSTGLVITAGSGGGGTLTDANGVALVFPSGFGSLTPAANRQEMDNNSTQLAAAVSAAQSAATTAAINSGQLSGVQSQLDGLETDLDGLPSTVDSLQDLLIAGRVQTRSPVLDNGKQILLVRGNDYNVASGQPLEWTDPNGNWPDLTGAAVTLTLRLKDTTGAGTTVGLTKAGTVVTPTGSDKLVRFAPVRADTLGLSLGNRVYRFDIQAVLATGETVTLVLGDVTVLEEQTR